MENKTAVVFNNIIKRLDEIRIYILKEIDGIEENDRRVHIYLLIFMRITDLLDSYLRLCSNSGVAARDIIFRSILESYNEFECLAYFDDHYPIFVKEGFQQWRKEIPESNVVERSCLSKAIDGFSNIQSSNIFEKFKKAGNEELYNRLYRPLSGNVHGSLKTLNKMYFKDGQFTYNEESVNEIFSKTSDVLIIVIDFHISIVDFLNFNNVIKNALRGELNILHQYLELSRCNKKELHPIAIKSYK